MINWLQDRSSSLGNCGFLDAAPLSGLLTARSSHDSYDWLKHSLKGLVNYLQEPLGILIFRITFLREYSV